jgi:AraC-like DNA-binding protein
MSRKRQRFVRTLAWEYPSGWDVPPHTHRWHQLVYASSGVMKLRAAGGTWIVPPSRAVWVPADVKHSIHMAGAVSMRTLYLAPRSSRSLPRDCRVMDVSPLLRELILRAVELGSLERGRPAHAALARLIVDELAPRPLAALHLPDPNDRRAARVARLVHDDPADRRPLHELAARSGASARTIERCFRLETGMSFGKWRQQLRLGVSLQRLAAGASVTEAAFDSGYDSVSAFIAAFRLTFGETPARYINRRSRGDGR